MRKEPKIIPDKDYLYRKIANDWYHHKANRVSSAAFRDKEASVDWARHITREKSIKSWPKHHLGEIQAEVPRRNNQEVRHAPSKRNYSHSLIIGQKTLPIRRQLAKNCKLIVMRKDLLN